MQILANRGGTPKVVGPYPVPKFTGGHICGLVLPPLNVGHYSMSAVYAREKNYAPGVSANVPLTVTAARSRSP